MSVSTTSTCIPWSKRGTRPAASAQRGVSSRSIAGSSARLRNDASARAPRGREARRGSSPPRARVMPIAAKTTTKRSSPRSRAPGRRSGPRARGRQPGAGEDRELLAADQRVQPVDGGDPGLDEVASGGRGAAGLIAPPLTSTRRSGTIGGAAVDRRARAVQDPPEHRGRHAEPARPRRRARRSCRAASGPGSPRSTWMTASPLRAR